MIARKSKRSGAGSWNTERQREEETVRNWEKAGLIFLAASALWGCSAAAGLPAKDTNRLEEILGEALTQARYTVKEEQKVDTGYYIEVEITPILNYQGLEPRLQELEEEAHEEATSVEGVSQEGDVVTVDVNQLYLDKVLDYCEEQLSQLQYDTAPQTIALDIRQTSQGELQLDMNQIKTIDETVLRLAS